VESEIGTITIAVLSTVILAFGFWIIKKITEM
jgi:hypothetical protein